MAKFIEDVLLYFSLKYDGDFYSIFDALNKKEEIDHALFAELKKQLKHPYTTVMSDHYPRYLLEDYNPPMVVYYKGNLGLLDDQNAERHCDVLVDGTKLMGAMRPRIEKGKISFEYLIASEKHDNLDVAMEIFNSHRECVKKEDRLLKGSNKKEIIH